MASNRQNSFKQLGLPDKGCAIKGLVFCYVKPLEKRKVRGLVPYCGQDGYRAQETQHPIDDLMISLAFINIFLPSIQYETETKDFNIQRSKTNPTKYKKM